MNSSEVGVAVSVRPDSQIPFPRIFGDPKPASLPGTLTTYSLVVTTLK